MAGNGNGKNGNYTCQQFIEAIPSTGGIVSEIARRVGCAWHTAKKYIDEYPTVNRAWQNERNRITDMAQSNIIEAIEDGDLQTSKWWLPVMNEEFRIPQRQEISAKFEGTVEHGIDGDAAETIFDILASVGAIAAPTGHTEDDEVHTTRTDC